MYKVEKRLAIKLGRLALPTCSSIECQSQSDIVKNVQNLEALRKENIQKKVNIVMAFVGSGVSKKTKGTADEPPVPSKRSKKTTKSMITENHAKGQHAIPVASNAGEPQRG